jgi:2,4-dichlorophenol 6-monooxygenase
MPDFDDGLAETELPAGRVETDVLIVGSGPAGGAAALCLSSLGVPNIMITKYRWTAHTPRAHITNQRAMEIFRDLGIEAQVLADATPHELVGDTVFCTSIAGEEIGRIRTWGTHPAREADYQLASPCLICDIPQTYLEPILVRNATARGTQTRFSTEYLAHAQDADGVDVRVRDRLTGAVYTIRARYLIGADGARSMVAADIGLPMEGEMDIAGSMNITFKADIAEYVGHRPSVLYWVIQPGSNIGGIGTGLVRMIRPWHEWLIVWGYDISGPPPAVDEQAATQIVRGLVGLPGLKVEITGTSLWGNNEMYATHLQSGRVFCAGDAIHRHPPSNGLGSNTSVQDAYNLAWKLALALRGVAASGLLDSYHAERHPVGEEVVGRTVRHARTGIEADPQDPATLMLREAQLLVAYPDSPLVAEQGTFDGGPVPGARAPDAGGLEQTGAAYPLRLFELLHGTEHVLLIYADTTEAVDRLRQVAGEALRRAPQHLRAYAVIAPEVPDPGWLPVGIVRDTANAFRTAYGVPGACAYLIRPDGYVGYRQQPLDAGGITQALGAVLR